MKTITRLVVIGCFALLAGGCSRAPLHPPFMRTDDLQQLTQSELLERFHYINGGCSRQYIRARQQLIDCERWLLGDESVRVGTRLAELNPEWNERLKRSLRLGYASAQVGMDEVEVQVLMGEPETKNITRLPGVTEEQWVYGLGNYVYLDNGVVTAVQF